MRAGRADHECDEAPRLRAGVDIGGTFTDVLLVDDRSGACWVGKTLTTPDDLAAGVRAGLAAVLQAAGVEAPAVATVIHGTTVVTNTLIERTG